MSKTFHGDGDQAESEQATDLQEKARVVDQAAGLEAFEAYIRGKTTFPKIKDRYGYTREVCQEFFAQAFENGWIKINPPRDSQLERALSEKWPEPTYYVLNAKDDAHFYRWAARAFLSELDLLLREWPPNRTLHIGIVSGRTTGNMIQSLCSEPWNDDSLQRNNVPKNVRVYALNVSQTNGFENLGGNANVLAWQLARKFRNECRHCDKIEAFGLSTDLFQSFGESQKSDTRPQTIEVIQNTDPVRLAKSLKDQEVDIKLDRALPDKSSLDIVITGVGNTGDGGKTEISLFQQYCNLNGIVLDPQIVGDIAYWPVTASGKPEQLVGQNNEQLVFYSAIRLEVLKEMVADGNKKVIVITRGQEKVDPVHAAIFQDKVADSGPYCNVLITDHATAAYLDMHRRV